MTDPETAESLRRRIASQRSRNAELKSALGSAERRVARLARIIEVVPGAVWGSEGTPGQPGYGMPYVSGEVERIFGYTPEECLRRANFWTSIVHPDDVPTVLRDLAAVAATGGRLSEYRFVTKDGREVWVEAHISLIRDANGAVVGRSVVAPDVTERVLAERARAALLARAEELSRRLDLLLGSIPGVVWEIRRRALIFVSDHLTALVGYRPEEVLADPEIWQRLTPPDERARVAREVEEILAAGGGIVQHRWLTRDGRIIWVETHVRVVHDEAGAPAGALCVTMDVTAQRVAEDERRRLKDQVIATQEATLAELSAPLLPISFEVLVMPLIGTLDAPRARRMIEALLHGIRAARAKVAILDITGARGVDAEAADALLRAARSARLLGARVVFTGVRPEAAQALVALGGDLEGLITCGTLEDGIAHATRRR